jgi:hypothetical protein
LSTRSAPHPDDIQPAREGLRVGLQLFLTPYQLEAMARRKGANRPISRREAVTILEAAAHEPMPPENMTA